MVKMWKLLNLPANFGVLLVRFGDLLCSDEAVQRRGGLYYFVNRFVAVRLRPIFKERYDESMGQALGTGSNGIMVL